MLIPEDNTYNDIRRKSLMQWLDEMEKHDDVAVRCGVRLARDYVEYMQSKLDEEEKKGRLKDVYLKKVSDKSR